MVKQQEVIVVQHPRVAALLLLRPVRELRHLGEEREARDGRV